MDKPIIIFGAEALGQMALEIFQSNDRVVYGMLDDHRELQGKEFSEVSVLGDFDDQGILKLIGKKCGAFVAVEDLKLRESLVQMLIDKRHTMPVNAIHQQAYVSSSAEMGHGNLISAGVVLNAHSRIGNHCLLHANCLLDYASILGDQVQIGSGVTVGSEVVIGEGVFVGAGATLISGIKIGARARIGAGSVVIADVEKEQTVFGNPAQEV